MVLIENDWSSLLIEMPGAVNTRNYGQWIYIFFKKCIQSRILEFVFGVI